MKSADEKIVAVLHPLFGAILGFVVFTFAFGGWRYVFTGSARSAFIGFPGLVLCLAIGAVLGWLAYRHRHREVGGVTPLAHDAATGYLLGMRVVVIGTCAVVLYFVWQLAKSLR